MRKRREWKEGREGTVMFKKEGRIETDDKKKKGGMCEGGNRGKWKN